MMIDTDGYLKLLDFGCSKKIKFFSQTVVGTPNYMSPEVLKGMEYSFNCDYWSVGVCCYLIYFGVLPFGEEINDVMKLYKDILKAKVKIPKDCPLAVKELIDGLLKKNVAERINNFDKVFDCQIFQNFDWDNLLRKRFKPPFIPISDDFWGKPNLKNLASPFDKFIDKKTEETIGGYSYDNLNEYNDMNDKYGENNYNENNDEFNNNWYEYF
jgi:serine/threonine protein kinase